MIYPPPLLQFVLDGRSISRRRWVVPFLSVSISCFVGSSTPEGCDVRGLPVLVCSVKPRCCFLHCLYSFAIVLRELESLHVLACTHVASKSRLDGVNMVLLAPS